MPVERRGTHVEAGCHGAQRHRVDAALVGVGRGEDGLLYFVLPDTSMGALAEQTLIDPRRSVMLPGDIDPVVIAAAMNPSMSSWVALRRRIAFTPGSRVLIMGATGSAGRLAVQIAKRLGASHVTAAGHDPQRLAQLGALGADAVIDLDGAPGDVSAQLAAAGRDVDVVIDYLWGEWTATALTAIVPARLDDAQRLTWIEVGSITGASSPIPSAALRACNLHLVGSGQGSVSPRDIVAELADLAAEVTTGSYDLDVRAVPLSQVTAAWAETATTSQRLVIVPNAA